MKLKIINIVISILEKLTKNKKIKSDKAESHSEKREARPEKGNDIYPLW